MRKIGIGLGAGLVRPHLGGIEEAVLAASSNGKQREQGQSPRAARVQFDTRELSGKRRTPLFPNVVSSGATDTVRHTRPRWRARVTQSVRDSLRRLSVWDHPVRRGAAMRTICRRRTNAHRASSNKHQAPADAFQSPRPRVAAKRTVAFSARPPAMQLTCAPAEAIHTTRYDRRSAPNPLSRTTARRARVIGLMHQC